MDGISPRTVENEDQRQKLVNLEHYFLSDNSDY